MRACTAELYPDEIVDWPPPRRSGDWHPTHRVEGDECGRCHAREGWPLSTQTCPRPSDTSERYRRAHGDKPARTKTVAAKKTKSKKRKAVMKREDPLSDVPAFFARVLERMEAGRVEYGDRSFDRPPAELLGEIEQELYDVCGWSYVLWYRVRRMRERMSELEAKP